jgi:hypothetical protein
MDNTMINILAIGYNLPIMEVVNRLINNHGNWKGTVELSREHAALKLESGKYDAVLLCAGVTSQDEIAFRQIIEKFNPEAILIRHFGGGSGLLESEIRLALDKKTC